jgi:hypothetical protein
LHAAALFSLAGLVFAITPYLRGPRLIQLPCFQHAISIELDTQQFTVKPPAAGEFPAVERLSISGKILHIGAWVTCCPRLRVLRAKFRGLRAGLLEQELGSLKDALRSREVAVSIHIWFCTHVPDCLSILSQAADLSPQELVYTDSKGEGQWDVTMPCFHQATSIEIEIPGISLMRPLGGELSALERLCLFGCEIVNLDEFVSCCPRLRVLRVDGDTLLRDITVHSTSLRELVLGTYNYCSGINIVTPELKKLTMEVRAAHGIGTSVLAPLVEKVSWRRRYTWPDPPVFGFWCLQRLSLQTTASNGERVLTHDGDEEDESVQQLPQAHVLSISMCASVSSVSCSIY